MMEIMKIEVTVMSTKSHMVKYRMSAPLFTAERITSDITTNIAKVHTESTATVTRRIVTIGPFIGGKIRRVFFFFFFFFFFLIKFIWLQNL